MQREPDLEGADVDTADAQPTSGPTHGVRPVAAIAALVALLLVGSIARDVRRQADAAVREDCLTRFNYLSTLNDVAVEPRYATAKRCLGVEVSDTGTWCVTFLLAPDSSWEVRSAFQAGVVQGVGVSGSFGAAKDTETVAVSVQGERAADEFVRGARDTELVVAVTKRRLTSRARSEC